MKHFRLLFLTISLAAMLTACFDTRDVEPPDTNNNSDWIPPSDYQTLLGNLSRALEKQNVQNYLRCFHQDSFQFIPATPVYTGNQIIWDSWSKLDEQTWLANVAANLGLTTGNGLAITEVDIQSFTSDSVRYIADYSLTMNHTDTSLTVNFKGQLVFVMKVNSFNEWEIWRWEDYETHPDSSWSALKLNYVQ